MKKYMIRCDIEGASGVVSYEQADPGKTEYMLGQRMFMSDLLSLVDGLKAGGADEIVIYDEHGHGRNIDLDRLPDGTTALCGKPPYRPDWAGGLDATFAGVVLLGFHSKAGTVGGLLPHSYESDIKNLLLNGVSVGEIGMEAAIAGDFNVPVILVVSDSTGVAEAETLLPEVTVVAVKEAFSESGALCYPLSVTSEKIRSAATGVVKTPPRVKPYRPGDRVTLEVELQNSVYLRTVRKLFPDEMKNHYTLLLEGSGATEVWAKYWKMKLCCQAETRRNR